MAKIDWQKNNTGLCRSCGRIYEQYMRQYCDCGGHNIIYHAELTQLNIAHIDCDAFFASVEKRDNPGLVDRPVIIGGGRRGVVAAACYHARVYGVRSAMPMWKALKLCPDAVVIRGNHKKYAIIGRQIKAIMHEFTPLVEPLSIDEAFLDLSGTERLHGRPPASSLVLLQNRIMDTTGISVSIGLSCNKFLAKTASDMDKPNGFSIIGKAEAVDFLADKPVEFVYGVGPAFARELKKRSIIFIKDVRKYSDRQMLTWFGEAGLRLAKLARAEDTRRVSTKSIRKSISSEITFDIDIGGGEHLQGKLWQVCVKTARRAKAKHLAGKVVSLKLKTKNFKTISRRRTFDQPIQLADSLYHICLPLLQNEYRGKNKYRKFRLIGVGISSLCEPQEVLGDLLDPQAVKRARAEAAADMVREKFGRNAVKTGRSLGVDK